jgi:hypothetical protein
VRRRHILAAALLGSALLPAAALANHATGSIGCDGATATYSVFPSGPQGAAWAVVIDGVRVTEGIFAFQGPTATLSVALAVPAGTHRVSLRSGWSVPRQVVPEHDVASATVTCSAPPSQPSTPTVSAGEPTTAAPVEDAAPVTVASPAAVSSEPAAPVALPLATMPGAPAAEPPARRSAHRAGRATTARRIRAGRHTVRRTATARTTKVRRTATSSTRRASTAARRPLPPRRAPIVAG